MTDTREISRRPLTAMQKAAQDRQQKMGAFIEAARANEDSITRSLKHHGLTFDFFMGALEVGLRNTMKADETFFEKVPVQSFIEAVLRATHFGLLPDGKEGAIVRFADGAAFLPMVEGFTKILWQTGAVTEINSGVVCEGDEFDFQEGDDGFVTHRRSLRRAADAETIGAWCVIKLATGGKIIEVCDLADLTKIAAVSRAQKGPRVDWKREMHRKAPFRRAMKRMPKTPALSGLIAHDDSTYDLARMSTPDARAPAIPQKALFGNKPAVRRERIAPPTADANQGAAESVQAPTESAATDAPATDGERDQAALISAIAAIDAAADMTTLMEATEIARQIEDLTADEATWIDERMRVGLERLAPPFALSAVLSSAKGVQTFDDAKVWRDDILTKMASIKDAAALGAFWKVNLEFVLAAGENGFIEEAERILEVAQGRHLRTEIGE